MRVSVSGRLLTNARFMQLANTAFSATICECSIRSMDSGFPETTSSPAFFAPSRKSLELIANDGATGL